MHLRPYGWLWVAGKEQSASVAFVPNRIVVLYSTHRSGFLWEQIERGK